MPRTKQADKVPANKQQGKKVCPCCGEEKKITQFYLSYSSTFSLDQRTPICAECCKQNSLNEDGSVNLDKLKEILLRTDKPLYYDLLDSAKKNVKKENSFISDEEVELHGYDILSSYFRLIAMRQNRAKSFSDSEKEGFMCTNNNKTFDEKLKIKSQYIVSDEIKVENNIQDIVWSEQDLKNKSYVLQSVGYDCFNDENYTEQNTKFLFNTMADYLTDDVLEDPHKMQRVISLVKTTLQLDNVDKLINSELRKKNPDSSLINSLTGIKDKLERTINSSANENGISAKSSGKGSKGSNALTNIMKEMGENGFEEIKVNLVNIKLSESYKEISADNAKSLFNELNFTTDEFAKMVATQSEEMIAYQDKLMKLEEEIRLLKVDNKRLKCKITELGGDE